MSEGNHETMAILPSALQALMNRAPEARGPGYGSGADVTPPAGSLKVIPIFGGIARRDSFWSTLFGGATVEKIMRDLRSAATDTAIKTVLLNIDSPGGTVNGLPELAAAVRSLAQRKKVIAISNSLNASAAYWIASQAHEVIATPEALTGSIGVFTVHEDYSQAMDHAGIKATYISAGKYKVEANPDQPLSAGARAHLQSLVDSAYNLFVADVARGRHTTPATVRSAYGEGRVLASDEAQRAGLIDRVSTSEALINSIFRESPEGARLANLRRKMDLSAAAAGDPIPESPDVQAARARLANMKRRLDLSEIA
jgi:capsid assembly protease